MIHVKNVSRHFTIVKKEPGIIASVKSLFHQKKSIKKAVSNVSFGLNQGEIVGFLGPNGSGKTTTLKMLSGIIHPTSGRVSVAGFEPSERKYDFLKTISLVMGQKTQLWWDLPAMDTFLLHKEIYEIPEQAYKKQLNLLIELLDIADVVTTPVRKLSLGQRMKCELVAALLHEPKVLFLDEPTIGLDVTSQQKIREFIERYNSEKSATILLTSHYMEDVKHLCKRVIVILEGKIVFDGDLSNLVKKYFYGKRLEVTFDQPVTRERLEYFGDVKEWVPKRVVLEVKQNDSIDIARKLLKEFAVDDLLINEIPVEEAMQFFFEKNKKNL